jgi:trans-aconitate 2-methyltransferase
MPYAFGDTDLAAQRLDLLARVFAKSSQPFLARNASRRVRLAADLGCGPGYTTHMIAQSLGCERAVGLDSSEDFVGLAQSKADGAMGFHIHDVTQIPLPEAPYDALYCRFLLTHLPEPLATLRRWATQLRPRGRLLVEETEWIETRVPAFARYIAIVDSMLADQGNELYVGRTLHGADDPEGLRRTESEVVRLAVANGRAAAMFHMNMQFWKQNPFVKDMAEIEDLERELAGMASGAESHKGIQWGLRQMIYERL